MRHRLTQMLTDELKPGQLIHLCLICVHLWPIKMNQ